MATSVSRRAVLAALASMPLILSSMGNGLSAREPSAPVKRFARSAQRHFGTCARIDQLNAEPALLEAVLAQCSSITPEIHLKWNSVENKKGQFWFEPVDKLLALARQSGLSVHGHTLLWEQSTPDWALRQMRRERDWGLVEEHINRVMKRYAGSIKRWDVVNEPIDTQNGARSLRQNTFHKVFGPNYIADALNTAHAAAPHAQLMLNDYSFEYDNSVERDRRAAFLKLLERLKGDGVPLHGVGIQAHLDLGKGPLSERGNRQFLQAIADMGLFILITELDVKERDYSASIATRDQRVSDEVRRYLDIVLAQDAVQGVTTWGMTDRFSWLSAKNRGLPYDVQMQPKPMLTALADAFSQAA